MFKFFRKIRRKLIDEGNLKRYLVYAIGETLLVMIGILLALQVNNANENRKTNEIRLRLYENLKIEFEYNKDKFEETKIRIDNLMNATREMLKYTGESADVLSKRTMDSLLYETLFSPTYDPSFVVYNDVMNSGKLDLIGNYKIRNGLFQWQTEYSDVIEDQNAVRRDIEDRIIPYLNKRIALRNIEKFGLMKGISDSKIHLDNRNILEDLEFENLMDNHLFSQTFAYQNYLKLGVVLDALIIELRKY